MYKRITLLFTLFLSFFGFTQNYSIEGIVKDEKQSSIAFANVILEDPQNTENLIGTTTDEQGYFKFEDLKSKMYNLTISFLGFERFSAKIKLVGNVDFKTIVLKRNEEVLKEVVVTAKRPTVKRLVDRIVFNVENSTLSNGNVLDVLKHTPGVIVRDGSISVKNTSPVVYINDRRVHLSIDEVQQLLEATPANNIKSVEVITNPPAKYDAEGGAVLNIKTSKNIIAGYHGSVFGNYQQGFQFPKFSLGTSHFFKSKKLSAYINYNISPRKDFRNNLEEINFIDNNSIVSSWETDFKRERESDNQNITGTITYDFNERNSLNFTANTLIAPRENSRTRVNSLTEIFGTNQALDSTFRTFNNLVSEKFNLAFSLGYIHKFNKGGEQLSVDLHHTDYDFSEFQNVDTGYFLPNASSSFRDNRFQTFSSQAIKLSTAQVDYRLPSEDGSVFEVGIKVATVDSDNILDQFNFENGFRVDDLDNSDIFKYNEKNYASYMSYEKDWENWSLKSGLRLEITETEGISQSTNSDNKNNYANLFPSFYLLHRIADDKVYFSYNNRIHRPRYKQLNPFKFFFNDNSFKSGDPNLLPQIDYRFILGYVLNDKFTFETYYRYEDNAAVQIVFQDNFSNKVKYLYTNIDRGVECGFDFLTDLKFSDNWELHFLSSIFYYENKFVALESDNQIFGNNMWSTYSRINNYFSLLEDKSLSMDLSLLYISPIVDGASVFSNRFGLDFSLKKTILKGRGAITLGVEDIFNTQNFTQTTKYLNQDIFFDSNIENRLLSFGFQYKFGNYQLKEIKKTIGPDERQRLEN